MRKILSIIIILIFSFASYAQDIRGSRGIFGTVYIGNSPSYGRWIDSVRNDTTGWLGSTRSIATLDAIYSFVSGRMGSGSGGGTYTASRGMNLAGADFRLGGSLDSTVAITFNNNEMLFRKSSVDSDLGHITFNTLDTITGVDTYGQDNGYAMYVDRVLRFPSYASTLYKGGNLFSLSVQVKDSAGLFSQGGGFGFSNKSFTHFEKMSGYSGRSVHMLGLGGSLGEGVPVHINLAGFTGTTSTSNYHYAKGYLIGSQSYLTIPTNDTLENWVGYYNKGFPTGHINYTYDYMGGFFGDATVARVANPWFLYGYSTRSKSLIAGPTGFGDSTIEASALVDISSTTKGIVIPRMTTAQKNAITSPATSLLVFDTDQIGYKYYNGSVWTSLGEDWVNVIDYGADPTGVANCVTAFANAIATGKNVYVPEGTFLFTGTANTTLLALGISQKMFGMGEKSILKTTSNARIIDIAAFSSIENVSFLGTSSKTSTSLPYQSAIFLATNDTGWAIRKVSFRNFGGDGSALGGAIYAATITNGPTIGGTIIDCQIYDSYIGILIKSRAEYINVIGSKIDNCGTGYWGDAGNLLFEGSTIELCTTGFKLTSNANDGHCVASNSQVNHNTTNLDITGITNGHTFTGMMFYAGNVNISTSTGIKFIACDFSTGTATLTGNANLSRIGSKWLTMTTSLVSGEGFAIMGEVRNNSTANAWIKQITADTNYFVGPTFLGTAGSTLGQLSISGNTSGTITLQPLAAAGTYTLTLPPDDGTSSQFLQTNGSGVLTWATPSGSGDVSKVGTPVNNQLGVWTGDGTIEGDANLTFSSSTLGIGVAGASTGLLTLSGVTSGTITIQPASIAGTYTLTLPTTDGGASEFLQTDGNGVLSWVAGGSGNVSNTGTPVDNQLAVWTSATVVEGVSTLTWSGTQLAVVGAATSTAGIDLFNGAYGSLLLGADLNASTRTNSTNKFGGIAAPHYTNSEEPFSVVRWAGTSAVNTVSYGSGVNPGYNSATSHDFYTATNNTTLVGTIRFSVGSAYVYVTNASLGVGVTAPTSTFQVTGAVAFTYTASAIDITASASHYTIDLTVTAKTVTLPTAVGINGRIYTIKLTASGSGTVATTSSQTIDGSTTYSLSAQYKFVTVQSNNANWIIIGQN